MMSKKEKEPKGISGWLILLTVGLITTALLYFFLLLIFFILVLTGNREFEIFVILFFSITMLAMFTYTIILEFKKKKEFPKWVIITSWCGVIITVIWSFIDKDLSDVSTAFVSALLWTMYCYLSKRVKNTFIN